MVLRTKVKVSQSKKAYTQYLSIPSAVVQDSQYHIEGDEELNLIIEPTLNIMILSKEELTIIPTGESSFEIRSDGIFIKTDHRDVKGVFFVRHKEDNLEK